MSTKTGDCVLFPHSERKPAVPRACKADIVQALGSDEFASLSQDFSDKDATMQLLC